MENTISITWEIEDVKQLDSTLTDNQAREVLRLAKHYHDRNIGINWVVLKLWIEEVKEHSKGD